MWFNAYDIVRNFDSLNGGVNGVTRGIEFTQWNGGATNSGRVTLVLRFYKSKNLLPGDKNCYMLQLHTDWYVPDCGWGWIGAGAGAGAGGRETF